MATTFSNSRRSGKKNERRKSSRSRKNQSPNLPDKRRSFTRGEKGVLGATALSPGLLSLGTGRFFLKRLDKANRRPVKSLDRISRAARELYPHLKKVKIKDTPGVVGGISFDPRGLGKTLIKKFRRGGFKGRFVSVQKSLGRTSPEVLAHELGHMAYGSARTRKVLKPVMMVSKLATQTGLAGLVSLLAQPLISRVKDEKLKRRLRTASGVAPIIAALPMLGDEATASLIGRKIIQKAYTKPRARRVALRHFRRLMIPAFSTYGALTLSAAALPFALSKVLKRRDKRLAALDRKSTRTSQRVRVRKTS